MMWPFHIHRWEVSGIQYGHTIPGWVIDKIGVDEAQKRGAGEAYSLVLYVCVCGKHRTEEIPGNWTREQLQK